MKPSPVAHLQTFAAVARRGSFGGAARELGVAASAVSQAVKQLEALLGVTLLARTTRSLALTDAGRRLLERAANGLDEALAAMTEVKAQPGATVGRIKSTVPRAAVPHVITPVLRCFVSDTLAWTSRWSPRTGSWTWSRRATTQVSA